MRTRVTGISLDVSAMTKMFAFAVVCCLILVLGL